MATLARNTAGHICRPQRMQAAADIPPARSGKVGCTPMLGNMYPRVPAAKTAAKVPNNLKRRVGTKSIVKAYDEPPVLVVYL